MADRHPGFLILAFFIQFAVGSIAFAQDLPEITYSEELSEPKQDLAPLDLTMFELGYRILKLPGKADPMFTLEWSDRIYVHPDREGLIIAKADLLSSKLIQAKTLYSIQTGFVAHLAQRDNLVTALYFEKISKDSATRVLERIGARDRKTAGGTFIRRWSSSLAASLLSVGKAVAATACVPVERSASTMGRWAGVLLEGASGCVVGFGSGVWNSTVGALVSGASGVLSAITDPRAAFRAVSEDFRRVVSFLEDFRSNLGEFKQTFDELPPKDQSRLVCEGITSMGTMILAPALLARQFPALAARANIRLSPKRTEAALPSEIARRAQVETELRAARRDIQFWRRQTDVRYANPSDQIRHLQDAENRARSLEEQLAKTPGAQIRAADSDMQGGTAAAIGFPGAAHGTICAAREVLSRRQSEMAQPHGSSPSGVAPVERSTSGSAPVR